MKVKQTVSLDHDYVEKYQLKFPNYPLSATLNLLLGEFIAIHEDTGVIPRKVARDAAKEVKEIVSDVVSQLEENNDNSRLSS